jgi:hypothetical protein
MVKCLKYEKTSKEIIDAHSQYVVRPKSIPSPKKLSFISFNTNCRNLNVIMAEWDLAVQHPVRRPRDLQFSLTNIQKNISARLTLNQNQHFLELTSMRVHLFLEVSPLNATKKQNTDLITFEIVMYNSFIVPRGYQHDEGFLRHYFIPTMLDALGLNDNSGVIYEILEHDYFNLREVGEWDRMMPGMINVNRIGFDFKSF